MNGVGFGNVGPHIRTKMTPWFPPREVTSDELSHFDAIYMLLPAYTSVFVLFLKQS